MSGWPPQMDDNDDGWDLFAVVRSCRAASRPSPATPPPQPGNPLQANGAAAESPNNFPAFFPNLTARVISHCSKPFSAGALQSKLPPWPCSSSAAPSMPRRPPSQSMPRSKRRRNQQKRVVCQVPADGLAADMWAWRKYGQKPIKGSPYPRGYYRCSSSKGCLARKQVERSRTDAGMFVITYTGEHNHPVPTHRNSLAGSTRQKLSIAGGEQGNQSESSPNTPLKREEGSGEEEIEEEEEEGDEEEEEDGVLLVEDMEVVGEDEVLFMGLEKFENSPSAVTPDKIAGSSPAKAGVSPAASPGIHGRKTVTAGENLFDFEACLGNWIL